MCRPILALPENARSKELLLYYEAKIQRMFETVDTPWGLNHHYGSGMWGGAMDENTWRAKYDGVIEHVGKTGKFPPARSDDPRVRKLGQWILNQRYRHANMPTHRVRALDAIGPWKWHVNASSISTEQKIDTLLKDPVVEDSGGWKIPEWAAAWADNMRRAYIGKGTTHVATIADKAMIEKYLPCLTMNGKEAHFRYTAMIFKSKFMDSETGEIAYPTVKEDKRAYMWILGIRNGNTTMTPDRGSFLESIGLGHVASTLYTEDARAAKRDRNLEHARKTNGEVSERCKKARLDAIRRTRSEIDAGPSVCN